LRRSQQSGGAYRRSAQRIEAAQSSFIQHRAGPKRLAKSDRRSLLLGTALASTLLFGNLVAPSTASAQAACPPGTFPPPDSIQIVNPGNDIVCVNAFDRNNGGINLSVIQLQTGLTSNAISVNNSGVLTATNAGGYGFGIFTMADGNYSLTNIDNSGAITANADQAGAIVGSSSGDDSPLSITNNGDLSADAGNDALAARGYTSGANSAVTITNTGDATVAGDGNAFGLSGQTVGSGSPVSIVNYGDIAATSDSGYSAGIFAGSYASEVSIENSGNLAAKAGVQAMSIFVQTAGGSVNIVNSGDLTASARGNAGVGIFAQTYGSDGRVAIHNAGVISVNSPGAYAGGIVGITSRDNSGISITNSGDITAANSQRLAAGMYTSTQGANSSITIKNSGNLSATGRARSFGILAMTSGTTSPISITNSGSIYGRSSGVYASSASGITIVNTGKILGGLGPAISVGAGSVEIHNSGQITGFVALDADDTFINQAGGLFDARQTSDFDASGAGGNDLFRNEEGGTVHVDGNASFVNLERFENQGLISLQDSGTGDSFTISNTSGNLNFVASGNSTLAVDAFLGGPSNSSSDTLTIEGNVSGVTTVEINNTNAGPGVLNTTGIKVVTVTGKTPTGNEFQLAEPIDTGFFDYDLFFTPTGSGFWSLKSYPGASAHLLPQLETAAQDIWHQGSSTWFDRTSDLRVLLNGGGAPAAYSPGGKSLGAAPSGNLTPAVWARGSGGWLGRDGSASTSAYGRSYNYNLDRDLQTMDFQVGLDMGKRDVLSEGDALVFGMLGGFVQANLDYSNLVRQFDFSGGQVGAYATYLKGGLFVDTLFNAHLYELDPNGTLGFPNSLDASTLGVRTDTGYRFGSFSGGAFLEPLATIEVMWANIDGFSQGGNTVSFNDDPNVRGRLGLRAGTTMQAWAGTLMEPFVIGSLWGNLSDNNQATLTSSGTTFRFQDNLQDVWAEVSAGVNFFNVSQTTSVFAKVDTTFGNDITGVGGKVGMRVAW